MRLLLALLFFSSTIFAQVEGRADSVYTAKTIYVGKIVGGTWLQVYLISVNNEQKVIPIKYIKRMVTRDRKLLIGSGVPLQTFTSYIMEIEPVREVPPDSLATKEIEKLSKARNDDRKTNALERIALVLSIQLALGVALILISLLAF